MALSRYKLTAALRLRLASQMLTEAAVDTLTDSTPEDSRQLAEARALINRVARRLEFRAHDDMDQEESDGS